MLGNVTGLRARPKGQVRCLERRDVRLFLSDEEPAQYRHVTLNCSTIDIYRLACVDLLLCLAGQCDDIMSKNPYADAVKMSKSLSTAIKMAVPTVHGGSRQRSAVLRSMTPEIPENLWSAGMLCSNGAYPRAIGRNPVPSF